MKELPTMNYNDLKERLNTGKFVLFFSADWCPDCSFIKPAMPEIEKDFPEYTFLSVNRDKNTDLAADMAIMGIPSFVVFNNGNEIGRLVNKKRKTKEQVEEFLNSLK